MMSLISNYHVILSLICIGVDGYYDRVKAVMPWVFGEGQKPPMSCDVWTFKGKDA